MLGRAAPVSRQNGGEVYPSGQFVASFSVLTITPKDRNYVAMKPQNFRPRPTNAAHPRHDIDGCKLYVITASSEAIDTAPFLAQLKEMKSRKTLTWALTPSFAIFHRGVILDYLVLAYWGNDNELFVDVDVFKQGGWQRAEQQYSFCLWDMEVLWFERNCFVQTLYTEQPDISDYRAHFFTNKGDL